MGETVRKLNIGSRVDDLVAGFASYLDVFKQENPFTTDQLRNHTNTSQIRQRFGTVTSAIANQEFLNALRLTLESWGMNSRGARLVNPDAFSLALRRRLPEMASLEGKKLDELGNGARGLADQLWKLIDTLSITETRSRLVAGTKALHHVLPELVPPMDRAYTASFFGWSPQRLQGHEAEFFLLAFPMFANIAERVQPDHYASDGWNSSTTKVVDNAVVGYCKHHRLDQASSHRALVAKAKEMGIYDQIVAEAKALAEARRNGST